MASAFRFLIREVYVPNPYRPLITLSGDVLEGCFEVNSYIDIPRSDGSQIRRLIILIERHNKFVQRVATGCDARLTYMAIDRADLDGFTEIACAEAVSASESC